MIEQNPILITGCPRSGTSIIGSVINISGAFGGEMSKRSMCTNDRVREEVVVPYFKNMEVDPSGQYPLPETSDLFIPAHWKQEVQQIMIDEGYQGGKWMYKDSRSALSWPVWNYAFPNAKWIIVRRRTGDIIQSCLKTGYMQAFASREKLDAINVSTEQEGWLWWVRQYEERFVEMIQAGLNCKVVWPERMIHGNYQQLYETLEWVGLRWNDSIVKKIDPLLWSSRKKERSI